MNTGSIRSTIDSAGVCVLENFLQRQVVADLLKDFSRLDSSADGVGQAPGVRVKRGVAFARRNLLACEFVQAFIATHFVQELVSAISLAARPVRAILFDKTGDANWTVPWHQDRSIAVRQRHDTPGFGPWSTKAGVVHVQPPVEFLREMFTLRFSLDPCPADNGPLRAIPATHHESLDAAAVDAAVARGPIVSCTTEAGGVVIMRPLLLHASSPAQAATHRRVLHVEFSPSTLPNGLQWAAA